MAKWSSSFSAVTVGYTDVFFATFKDVLGRLLIVCTANGPDGKTEQHCGRKFPWLHFIIPFQLSLDGHGPMDYGQPRNPFFPLAQ